MDGWLLLVFACQYWSELASRGQYWSALLLTGLNWFVLAVSVFYCDQLIKFCVFSGQWTVLQRDLLYGPCLWTDEVRSRPEPCQPLTVFSWGSVLRTIRNVGWCLSTELKWWSRWSDDSTAASSVVVPPPPPLKITVSVFSEGSQSRSPQSPSPPTPKPRSTFSVSPQTHHDNTKVSTEVNTEQQTDSKMRKGDRWSCQSPGTTWVLLW